MKTKIFFLGFFSSLLLLILSCLIIFMILYYQKDVSEDTSIFSEPNNQITIYQGDSCEIYYSKYNYKKMVHECLSSTYSIPDFEKCSILRKDNCWKKLFLVDDDKDKEKLKTEEKKFANDTVKKYRKKIEKITSIQYTEKKEDAKLKSCLEERNEWDYKLKCFSDDTIKKCINKKERLRNKRADWGDYVYSIYFPNTEKGKADEKAYFDKVFVDLRKRIAKKILIYKNECQMELNKKD